MPDAAPSITFRRAREAGACVDSYHRMADYLGGVTLWGRDRPVPILTVLEVCGLADALWALEAVGATRVLRLFAFDCAERVLPIFERERPDDDRPRRAIETARAHAEGRASDEELRAAEAAAGDAAWAAAGDAAGAAWAARAAARAAARDAEAAAGDAAWAAERDWQAARLRELLEGP